MKKTKQPIRLLANCVLMRRNAKTKRAKVSAEWQGQGEILALGAGVRELAVGDRVFFRGPGLPIDVEGRKGLLLRQSDILAINNMPENEVSAGTAKASPRTRERTGRRFGRAGI